MQKKIMMMATIVCTFTLTIGFTIWLPLRNTQADTTSATVGATITVDGHSEQRVQPDIAIIDASVTSNGKDANSAQIANAAALLTIMNALMKAGTPSSDVFTMWYSIHPNYGSPDKNNQPQMSGFQAITSLQVMVRNLSKVGQIVDTLVKSGVNQINNVQYQVSNPLAIEETAYDAALANAKSQVENIAHSLGVAVTGVQSVDATNRSYQDPLLLQATVNSNNNILPSPEAQSIMTNVHVVYTINNGSSSQTQTANPMKP